MTVLKPTEDACVGGQCAENAFRKPPNKIKKSVLRGPIRRKNNKKVRDVNKTKKV